MWTPEYRSWRHGGWYVTNVRYPQGGCGCVSRNYSDKKWRIVCGRPHEETFASRDDAARAERAITLLKCACGTVARITDLFCAECGETVKNGGLLA